MRPPIAFKSLRPKRLLALSRRWQRRVIFVGGAFCVGFVAIFIAKASDFTFALFNKLEAAFPYFLFIVAPLGFALSAWLVRRVFPNTQGSGIPQAIAARGMKTATERSEFVGLRAAVGKVLLTLFSLLIGASVGREGPTVQVGASMMFMVGRLTPRRQPGLIVAGAAAGVAAAFNTPLAGIVFGIEEISRGFEARTSSLIISAVVLAGLTSLAFLGDYSYFGSTAVGLPAQAWLAVPICGVAGGLAGGTFSRILIIVANGVPGRAGKWIGERPIAFAALCGLLVAIIGYVSGGTTCGTGYAEARSVVHGAHGLSFAFAPLKFLATTISSISGIPGGIFSPSLSVGAGIGADVASLFPSSPIAPIVLLGMVGYFAGVVQAPITSFVIVSEMTSDHHLLIPLMAAALIGSVISRLVCREGVYHALSKRYLPTASA